LEKGQEQIPLTQTKAPEIPVLQTPHNEERGKKRDRTDGTPTGTSTDQQGEKRQRLNPYAEEEITEETIGNIRGEGTSEQQIPPILETSASSFQQEQEKQPGGEVSSSKQ